MNILIRSDSSSKIGTGHILRDMVLASQYKNDNIIFATMALKGNINFKILDTGYELKLLRTNEFDELNSLIKNSKIDMLIIDHYKIDYIFEKKLKEYNKNLTIFAFDDTYNKHCCDILLNHNIYANKNRYQNLVNENCEIRCGSSWTLLRKEFLEQNKIIKNNNEINIFIALGGSDSKNLNRKILNVLERFSINAAIKVTVATTSSNKYLIDLMAYTNKRNWIELKINNNNIAELMSRSNFLIITASGIINEAYYLNLPFIAIKTAKNQIEMFKYLKQNQYKTMDKFNKKLLKKYINYFMETA